MLLMFTLAVSCLITSSLSWFIDRIFQVPIVLHSIGLYFHHKTHPQQRAISALGPPLQLSLKLLVIVLCSSPVAYWTHSDLEVGVGLVFKPFAFFLPFILYTGFSRHKYWSELPFPPPVDYILSELFTRPRPSYVALRCMDHSFTELWKPLCHDKAMIHEGQVIVSRFSLFQVSRYLLNKSEI